MDTALIRRRNVLAIIETQFNGSRAAFARKIERDDSFLSQLLAVKGGGKRNIGERVARHIERKLGLPRNALDQPEGAPAARQELALYSLDPDRQARLLALFDQLTPPQQKEFMDNIGAAVEGNIATHKYMSNRLSGVSHERAAAHLPAAPKGGKK